MERMTPIRLAALLFLSAGWCLAQPPDELFRRGNAAYQQGRFEEAAAHYESARRDGLRHWALYYNLGNAYYRSGRTGKAIANYARAFRLNSGQRDVVYNLRLASTKAGDPQAPAGSLAAFFWRLFFLPSLNLLSGLASAFFIALAVWLGARLPGRRSWRPGIAPALGAGLLVFGSWLGARAYLAEKPEGIVASPVAEVRGGPSPGYPANFTVPEGHRVIILKEQEPVAGWLEIGVPEQGLKGWVPDDSIEIL